MKGHRHDIAVNPLVSLTAVQTASVIETAHLEATLPSEMMATHAEAAPAASTHPAIGTRLPARRELMWTFLWLDGDFALTFFERIFARFIPLFTDDPPASNTEIGLMTGTFIGVANLF